MNIKIPHHLNLAKGFYFTGEHRSPAIKQAFYNCLDTTGVKVIDGKNLPLSQRISACVFSANYQMKGTFWIVTKNFDSLPFDVQLQYIDSLV